MSFVQSPESLNKYAQIRAKWQAQREIRVSAAKCTETIFCLSEYCGRYGLR
jgi:hypothetical protein